MKLENEFFQSFFFSFLLGVICSTLVVTIFLIIITKDNYDKRTRENIINLEKKNTAMTINSINILLTTKFLKVQSSLNELILYYQKKSKELLIHQNSNPKLNNKYLKCVLNVDDNYCETTSEDTSNIAYWLLDANTNEKDLEDKIDVKKQLIAYSKIIPNIESILETTSPNIFCYYFYFDKTELYTSFPLINDCGYGFLDRVKNFDYEDTDCIDNEGKYYTVYKVKCEAFFLNMIKSKTGAFDNNYLSNQHKTIFITNFYGLIDYENLGLEIDREFSMCIEFDDFITKGKGYACVDVIFEDMIFPLDTLNSKMMGYYFISNVGFNNVFYFPKGTITPKTSTENIYKWGLNFKLEEKIYFHEHLRKILSSNYIDYIDDYVYNEVFVNGKNSSGQYFFINGEKYKYSIYPIILENLRGKKEHVMSIIHIYQDDSFLEEINKYTSSIVIEIILELIIFIIFGSCLLFIIYLTFNTLVKYIVIPIKNINYMLKGINIGGNKRLVYLEFLKKKQDENIEKLTNAFIYERKSNNNKNENNFNNNDNHNDKDNLINKESLNDNNLIYDKDMAYSEFDKKYDEESGYIDKELNFYDFDEQLLQYRPLEIDNLIKSLLDLKAAKELTLMDREIEKTINYTHSEQIFRDFKNKEGAIICQSNIGNLQSRLLKYDKAIYHIVLSLQDYKLKKFLNQNLNDEFDEDNTLFYKISNSFNHQKTREKSNRLEKKQINNSNNNYSQQLIGILINTRYPRLIYSYYMFFKNMQKIHISNLDIINGQFMNTAFHTVDYYHKIIIQFIYLSYVKNDLIKIGESILDYLEFLIKYKLKASSNEKIFLKIFNRNLPEFHEKQIFKKKIFNKIISWFNLFDDYLFYVKEYLSLDATKCIVDDYSHSLNTDNFQFNLESQTAFMFRVNIQKSFFLKGKFCLCCKNYNDALFYFIRAAKKESIVIDGLIKKRSLKHLFKLMKIMKKEYETFDLKNLIMKKKLREYKRDKNKLFTKKINNGKKASIRTKKEEIINNITFGEKIDEIKNEIIQDIGECNNKQENGKENSQKEYVSIMDYGHYKNINLDDIKSIRRIRFTEAGDSTPEEFSKEEIESIYNYLKGLKVGEKTNMSCDDNTTVYTITMNNETEYSIEIECNWFVIDNERFAVK